MRYAKIRKMDISNGLGVRVSIFVQGCSFNCKNCFNPETHNFDGGREFTDETIHKLLELCKKDRIKGLSILGGEPLHPKNLDGVYEIVYNFKEKYPNKDIWIWTGFLFEDLLKNDKIKEILKYCDVLIDGQFVEEKKNLNLKFRGSSNQRVIDIKKTLDSEMIIELEY